MGLVESLGLLGRQIEKEYAGMTASVTQVVGIAELGESAAPSAVR